MEDQQMQTTEPARGKVQRRNSFSGTGCLIQGFGLLLGVVLFVLLPVIGWVLGPLVALGMLIAGSHMATSYECSVCRNPVASRRVRLCPTCHATLS